MNIVIFGHEKDNVLTCCRSIEKGEVISLDKMEVVATQEVPIYHKIALTDIQEGEYVMKYGMPIGVASCFIKKGSHVHVANLESARGRGDKKESK